MEIELLKEEALEEVVGGVKPDLTGKARACEALMGEGKEINANQHAIDNVCLAK
jgi:hypothetical protein